MALYGRQAITTCFHGPTNTRGSRYSATAEAGRVYVNADDALDYTDNHRLAALKLAAKFDWKGALTFGALHGGGYAWVWVTRDTTVAVR